MRACATRSRQRGRRNRRHTSGWTTRSHEWRHDQTRRSYTVPRTATQKEQHEKRVPPKRRCASSDLLPAVLWRPSARYPSRSRSRSGTSRTACTTAARTLGAARTRRKPRRGGNRATDFVWQPKKHQSEIFVTPRPARSRVWLRIRDRDRDFHSRGHAARRGHARVRDAPACGCSRGHKVCPPTRDDVDVADVARRIRRRRAPSRRVSRLRVPGVSAPPGAPRRAADAPARLRGVVGAGAGAGRDDHP